MRRTAGPVHPATARRGAGPRSGRRRAAAHRSQGAGRSMTVRDRMSV
ncbi:hypothetical protein OG698_18730 [Streptomyces sp. NBC_01003]|nr:hypothetical protein OG698_18730 [Streptomyces sp. NBC_01003]